MKKFIKKSPILFGALVGLLLPIAFFIFCIISLFIPSFNFLIILVSILQFVETVQNYTNIKLTHHQPGIFSIPSLTLYGFLFVWIICILVGIFIGACYKIYAQGTPKSKKY